MVLIVHLCVTLIAFVVRLFIIRNMISLSVYKYVREAIIPCLYVAIPSVGLAMIFKIIFPHNFWGACGVAVLSGMTVIIFSFLVGLTANERQFILSKLPISRIKR